MTSARHISRRIAAQLLYAYDMGNTSDHSAAAFLEECEIDPKYKTFALSLFDGAKAGKDGLDLLIKERLNPNWTIDRLGRTELAILRLACYELTSTDTDAPIVINEAVMLAKELADDSAPPLINGILESVRKDRAGIDRGEKNAAKAE